MKKYQGIIAIVYNANGDTSPAKTRYYDTEEDARIAAEELARRNKGTFVNVISKN